MIERGFLDSLYHELYMAKAKVEALSAINTFAAVDGCQCSVDAERHDVALTAAKDRLETANVMISKYLAAHNGLHT